MGQRATRREQALLELIERLEHREITRKIELFEHIKAGCREIQNSIKNQKQKAYMWELIAEIEGCLSLEMTILRAIDRTRRTNAAIDTDYYRLKLSESKKIEERQLEILIPMFAKHGGMSVDEKARKKKEEVKELFKLFIATTSNSHKRTLELLEKIS